MSNPKISVLLPVYNVEKFIDIALQSLLSQSFDEFEVILVNDGSTDASGIICENYATKDPRVRVIHQNNQGFGEARNIGFKFARGEYVYFMDSDDCIERDLLKDNYDIAKRDNADIVIFGHRKVYASSKVSNVVDVIPPLYESVDLQFSKEPILHVLNRGCGLAVWEQLIRRQLITESRIEFPDFKREADVAFLLSLYCHCKVISTNSRIYYNYNSFYGTNKFNPESIRNHKELFRRLNVLLGDSHYDGLLYDTYVRFFTLWFVHVIPINFVTAKGIGVSERKNGLRALINDIEIERWLDGISLFKRINLFTRISLIVFKSNNVFLLIQFTRIKVFVKRNFSLNFKNIIYQ